MTHFEFKNPFIQFFNKFQNQLRKKDFINEKQREISQFFLYKNPLKRNFLENIHLLELNRRNL